MEAAGSHSFLSSAANSVFTFINAGRREELAMAAVALAVIMLSTLLWLSRVLRRGQRVPGPVVWPMLGSIVELRSNIDRMSDWYNIYFSNEVKTFSFALPGFPRSKKVIATVDPVNVEYMLTNIQIYGKGSGLRDRLGDFLGNGFFVSDGEVWRRHRKIASTEFSTRKLREHSNTVFREDAVKLANILKRAMAAHEPVEFQNLALRMTIDSICKVAFGVELGAISASLPDIPFAAAFDTAQALIAKRIVNPLFKLERALDMGVERRLREATRDIDLFAKNVITKRRGEIAAARNAGKEFEKDDLLSKFMGHNSGTEDSYSDKELRDVIVDFMLAGRDTTAVTLAWFMHEICLHPEIANKIYEEGVEVMGKHSDFETMAEHLTHETLGRMHYLHAALSESLRLNPPVPRDSKFALADDVLPDGTEVKKGNFVQYVPYSMGRMPFLWGPDALENKPERWLKDGVFQSVSPFKFSVFQGGPRICLGRDSAYLHLKLTLTLIIHFFTFQLVPGQEITYTMTLIVPLKNGVKIVLSPRQ